MAPSAKKIVYIGATYTQSCYRLALAAVAKRLGMQFDYFEASGPKEGALFSGTAAVVIVNCCNCRPSDWNPIFRPGTPLVAIGCPECSPSVDGFRRFRRPDEIGEFLEQVLIHLM